MERGERWERGEGVRSQVWLSWSWWVLTVKRFKVITDSHVVRPGPPKSCVILGMLPDHLVYTYSVEKGTKVQKSQELRLRSHSYCKVEQSLQLDLALGLSTFNLAW